MNGTITSNASGNPRIDAVVIKLDIGVTPNNFANNIASIVVVAGTPAASPSAPDDAAIQTAVGAGNPFYRLANVTVANGASSITNANISDTRSITKLKSANQTGGAMYFSAPRTNGGFDRNAAVIYVGLSENDITGSEAIHQMNIGAGTFTELRIRVLNNSMTGATTVKLRVNGADTALSMTITAGTTGSFSASGSIAVAAGDLVALAIDSTASAGGNHLDYQSLIVKFTPA